MIMLPERSRIKLEFSLFLSFLSPSMGLIRGAPKSSSSLNPKTAKSCDGGVKLSVTGDIEERVFGGHNLQLL